MKVSSFSSAAPLLFIGFVQCTGNDGGGNLVPALPDPTDPSGAVTPAAPDDGSSVDGDGAAPIDSGSGSGSTLVQDGGQADADAGSSPACAYATTMTCGSSSSVGAVRGDTGSDVIELSGTTSAWFRFDVTEAAPSVLPTSLSFRADLQSPAGMNFDLRAYTTPCESGTYGESIGGAGALDTVSGRWGDVPLLDDSRTVIVEVRYVSGGLCGSDARWTLRLLGNPS